MNKLVDVPVSRKAIEGIKRDKIKINRGIVLFIIYLLIIYMIMPSKIVELNTITVATYDSYKTANINNSVKYNYILKKYKLSKEQFNILSAIVLSEADNTYEDAYAVINTIYNRTISKNWVRSVNAYFGKGNGNNLYYQAISPRQFTVYSSGSYKRNLNKTNAAGYQAILDFLYSENIMHDYLSFRSHSIKIKNSESFSKNGNNYFNKIKEGNRI